MHTCLPVFLRPNHYTFTGVLRKCLISFMNCWFIVEAQKHIYNCLFLQEKSHRGEKLHKNKSINVEETVVLCFKTLSTLFLILKGLLVFTACFKLTLVSIWLPFIEAKL
jgi:hypothetical protein